MNRYTAKQKVIAGVIALGVIGTPVLAASLQEEGSPITKRTTVTAGAEDIQQVTATPISNQTASASEAPSGQVERVILDKTLDEFLEEQEQQRQHEQQKQTATAQVSSAPSSKTNTSARDIAAQPSNSTRANSQTVSKERASGRIEDETLRELRARGVTPAQLAKLERLLASGTAPDKLIDALNEKGERDIAIALQHEKAAKARKQSAHEPPNADPEDQGLKKSHDREKDKDEDRDKDEHEDKDKDTGEDKKEKKDKSQQDKDKEKYENEGDKKKDD